MRSSTRRRPPILTAGVALCVACSSAPVSAAGSGAPAADTPETRTAAVGDTIQLGLGESASVDAGRLTLTFVLRGADSRCPVDVVCVWAGDVAVRIRARVGASSGDHELHTGIEPRSAVIDRYVVTLVGVLPYPGTEPPQGSVRPPIALLRVARR